MSESKLTLPMQKQSDMVAATKHLLSLARAGKIAAIGYAVITVDDDSGMSAGTNAAWTDETTIRESLEETIQTLYGRVSEKIHPPLLLVL